MNDTGEGAGRATLHRVDLGPLLNAHAFLRVERPPTLWEVDADDEPLIRMLGEMLAAALGTGVELADVVLRVNNVETATEDDDEGTAPPVGQFVALTVIGGPAERPAVVWTPARADPLFVNADLDAAARGAGVRWAYTTRDHGRFSMTAFFPRLP